MNSYREDCIERKLVRRGIVQPRAVSNTKKPTDKPWLAVYFNNQRQQWLVWSDYRFEHDASKVMNKMIRYWQMYVVHRDVFDRTYRHYRGEVDNGKCSSFCFGSDA
jgi:hypothetical protein